MGCDIHMGVEVRRDGAWSMVPPLPVKQDGDSYIEVPWEDEKSAAHIASERNYRLFAALAGVRNYDDVTPIARPRGIPEDASSKYREWAEDWGVDGHSHSWLTLRELQEAEWPGTPYMLENTRGFREGTIPAIAKFGGPDDVRIVFFFDN